MKGAVEVQRRLACTSILLSCLLSIADEARGAEAKPTDRSRDDTCEDACEVQLELALSTGTIEQLAKEARAEGDTARAAAISGDATRIAFASNRDLLRDGSNADGNLEIFLLDTTVGELEQITSSEGGTGSVSPRLGRAGTRIVFASDRDLLRDGSNTDDEVQLFLYDVLTGGIAQLTHVDGGLASFATALELSLDDAGVRLAFASDRDVLGDGRNDDENLEIFLLDTTTRALQQLTATVGGKGSFAPEIDGGGMRVRWTTDRSVELAPRRSRSPSRGARVAGTTRKGPRRGR
jgi:hypothetical protein